LQTKLGILGLLATIEDTTDYASLKPFAEEIVLGDVEVQVLSLERLIEVKKRLMRPKDRLMLMHLEAALDERRKSGK
jgi:hypothetical protein